MPARSKAQQRLMGAAEHGAMFPAAQRLRGSMTYKQLHDFASGPMKGKPEHVKKPAAAGTQHPHKNLGKYLHKKKR